MRIEPPSKPKLILGVVVVGFFIIVGVVTAANNNENSSPASDTISTTVAVPTCGPNAYVDATGACVPLEPADTQPVDTDTYVPPPVGDNTDSGDSDGGFDPHVRVCVGHIVRVCS
jgi:hypothetical protein